MYGAHIGTGGGAAGMGVVGLQMGSSLMLILAMVMMLMTIVSVARRAGRRGEHQRP